MNTVFTFTHTPATLGKLDISYSVGDDGMMRLDSITSRPGKQGKLVTELFWAGADGWRENISVKYWRNGRRDEATFASDDPNLSAWWADIDAYINSLECTERVQKHFAKKLHVLMNAYWPEWIGEREPS